jgi:hypothetical protein
MTLSALIRKRDIREPCYCYSCYFCYSTQGGSGNRSKNSNCSSSKPHGTRNRTAIRAWLALIEETDPATIAEVIGQCQRDADARDYFTGRAAAELPKPDPFPDDRRTCDKCANLIARRCQAAKRGEIVASRNYEPIRDLPRRCEGYAPGATDTDRRPGRDRWPGLREVTP